MKASTLFAITVSLLLGLGAVAGARYAGLFDKKDVPMPAKEPPIRVLVAAANLFRGVTVTADQVAVVEVPSESPQYGQYKRDQIKFVPPRAAAAAFRVPLRNIEANTPLTKELFEEIDLPGAISERLGKGMKAVNVSVQKGNAAGGVIRTGEYVDVMLTTDINYRGEKFTDSLKTACIARGCKVIMKRNTIWTPLAADPDGKPVNFTLEANPYRALLIQFASNRGTLSLLPTAAPVSSGGTGSFSDLDSTEYGGEQDRVDATNRGDQTVSSRDLIRIFGLIPPPPVVAAPPPPPPVVTRNISGTEFAPSKLFTTDGAPLGTAPPGSTADSVMRGSRPAQPAPAPAPPTTDGFMFNAPVPQKADCPTCPKK